MGTKNKAAWCEDCGWVSIYAFKWPASQTYCPDCRMRVLMSPSEAWKAHKVSTEEYERHKNRAHHPDWMRESANE